MADDVIRSILRRCSLEWLVLLAKLIAAAGGAVFG